MPLRPRPVERNSAHSKAGYRLYLIFAFFHVSDFRHARPYVQSGGKIIQAVARSDCIYFNLAAVCIACPTGEAESGCLVPHEDTEADPLNGSADEPTLRKFAIHTVILRYPPQYAPERVLLQTRLQR